MKKLLFLVAAAVAGVSFAEQAAQWTFDGSTITDGEWTFAATVKNDTELTVGACAENGYPGIPSPLDFAKPVTDGGTEYDIVKLNTQLGSNAGGYSKSGTTPAGLAVSALYLPDGGKLTTIGERAFARMTNCTLVSPYIPDSVTSLGGGAFTACPAVQPLRLVGVNGTVDFNSFYNSKITSVVFGPGLKVIGGAYGVGAFESCANLETVTFDPEMSDGSFSGSSYGPFSGCSKLAGTLDLRGFKSLNLDAAFSKAICEKVIVGSNCVKMIVNTFGSMSKLTEIEFLGKPPVFYQTYSSSSPTDEPKLNFGRTAVVTTIVHQAYIEEPNSRGKTWLDFAAKKRIWNAETTWNASFVYDGVTVENRPLIAPDGIDPIEEEEKVINYDGMSWVFDVENETLGDGKWLFAVLADGANLKVGSCLKWPDELSKLDFSMVATNEAGEAFAITELNTAFGPSNTSTSDAGLRVGELVLNDGLLSIGAAAFSRLDNCTNVVNFLPDTVTKIGSYAFYKIPVQQDLSLKGVAYLGTGTKGSQSTFTFGSSGITGVTFGPGLKEINSWANAAFNGCKSLAYVTFDQATMDASFGGIRSDGFYGCSKLTGTVDLSGFSNLSYISDYGGGNNIFSGTKVEKFIVGEQCTKLAAGFFDGDTSLKEVVFMGPPPEITTNANTSSGWSARKSSKFYNYGQSSLKITTYITKENREAWAPYVLYNGQPVDKVPPGKGVTWKPEYVTEGIDLSLRPVMVLDMVPGLMLLVK